MSNTLLTNAVSRISAAAANTAADCTSVVTKELVVVIDCAKCGWHWIPRRNTLPKVCPHCKNYNFWLPKVPGVGRPRKSVQTRKPEVHE